MKKLSFAAVALIGGTVFGYSTNEWTGAVNDWNWSEAGNFRDGLPASGDIVKIPAGKTVKLNASTDSGSLAVVNSLRQIWPAASDSVMQVTVAEGEADFAVPFTSYNFNHGDIPCYTNGVLAKLGAGQLNLTALLDIDNVHAVEYYTTLKIEAGTVKFPQECDTINGTFLGKVEIAKDATLIPYGISDTSLKPGTEKCPIYFCEITGEGMITNAPCADEYMLRPRGWNITSTFAGVISRAFCLWFAGGSWNLTGNDSDMREFVNLQGNYGTGSGENATGVLGVKYFGTLGKKSSIGPCGNTLSFRGDGGALKYLGQGETTDKILFLQAGADKYYQFFDGGPYGGLIWMGNIATSVYQGMMQCLVLTGSHPEPCVVGGALTAGDQQKDGVTVTGGAFFIKRGSGTWRFAETVTSCGGASARANRTNFTIEGGTLQFDSLAETNQYCSLGVGTRIQSPYNGYYDASKNIDWFFTLGKTNVAETLPYLDFTNALYSINAYTGGVAVSTRTIGLVGDGGIRNTSDHRFRLSGVKAVSTGLKQLYLDGARDGGDEILDITDGTAGGTVGIVKKGSGTWTIGGDLTFTGPVDVQEGTLVVKRYSPRYSWFRYTIRKTNTASGGTPFMIMELGVYDKDGKVLTQGTQTKLFGWTNVLDYAELDPGYAAYYNPSRANSIRSTPTGGASGYFNDPRDINRAFDGSLGGNGWNRNWNQTILPGTPASWPACEFRLPLNSQAAASYDFYRPGGANYGDKSRLVVSWTMEGSHDGLHWQELHKVDDDALPASGTHWASGHKTSTTLSPHTTGYAISGSRDTAVTVVPLSVKMAAGTTLKADLTEAEDGDAVTVKAISFSPDGAGNFDGIEFSENGVLDLTEVTELGATTEIPADFGENFDVLNGWTLKVNGKARPGLEFKVSKSGIAIRRKPLKVIFQ